MLAQAAPASYRLFESNTASLPAHHQRSWKEANRMDLCGDCGCKPGWHSLYCPRAQRSMTAIGRRLRSDEQASSLLDPAAPKLPERK